MCVGFYTLEHPEYALVLCSNRDEYLERPTEFARFHSFDKPKEHSLPEGNILSGIDVRAGGTWLGVNRSGRLAFLTNITEEYKTYGSSRGDLVANFLSSDSEEDVHNLIPPDAKYAGFNLLLLTPSTRGEHALTFDGTYVTNHGGGGTLVVRSLTDAERRCGGLSNGIDGKGAELWPKVQHGLHLFKSIIKAVSPTTPEKELADNLFELLTWKPSQLPSARSELRNTVQVEPFIMQGSQEFYGTRLSTVILVKRTGEVLFIERDRWKVVDAKPVLSDHSSQREFRFVLEPVH
ncbi:NRDE protein-domain-containing protein [Suillus fuscotomentosus]|uniref:NRDE protein-domain-containing protein n=1 Tax=Suillus fuscotomentosus TaxID=1912939 RepID=A0AAD4E7C9_9AGAM|nr:NRDE protein-domain-containing protein [Suillus fuscotomentosus]KAG1901090.1 NRDE protein-domain-containing protein [Suillus fuscotomentosus]